MFIVFRNIYNIPLLTGLTGGKFIDKDKNWSKIKEIRAVKIVPLC